MKSFPRVLIVEDEAAIAELVAVNLRHNGFTPIWAEDGEAAQRELGAVLPDVVLLDWNMPIMNGLEFLHELTRRQLANPPKVIFCTTENDLDHIRAAVAAGADEYVMKPFDRETLEGKLQLVGVA